MRRHRHGKASVLAAGLHRQKAALPLHVRRGIPGRSDRLRTRDPLRRMYAQRAGDARQTVRVPRTRRSGHELRNGYRADERHSAPCPCAHQIILKNNNSPSDFIEIGRVSVYFVKKSTSSAGESNNTSAPCSSRNARSRKPHVTERQGRPEFFAVIISTSESPM